MNVFMIQTNGRDIHEAAQLECIQGGEANRPTFVNEPLRHQRYYDA